MEKFFSTARRFAERFPTLLLLSSIGAWYAYGMAFDDYQNWIARYKPVALAMVVSVTIQACVEAWRNSRKCRIAGAIASVAAFSALHVCFARIGATNTESFMIRYYSIFGAMLALLAFFLSYAKGNGNKMPMLVGAATLGLLSSLAFCGVVCAIVLALEKLFGVKVHWHFYDFMFYLTLASILPLAFTAFAFQRDFNIPPKTHRVVFEYFLLPVLLVNLLILWAYLAKTIVRFTLPKGGLTWLVSLACAIWMLSYSIFTYSETKTATLFRRYVGFLVVPLLVLQAMALHARISAYGVTPKRYLAVLYSLFAVAFLVVTFARRGRYQRIVYLVFAGLLLFAALSPLSAIAVSVWSQQRRIEALYKEAGLFKDGKIITKDADWILSDDSRREVLSAGHFLCNFRKTLGIYVKTGDSPYYIFAERVALERYGIDTKRTDWERGILRGKNKRPEHGLVPRTADLANKNPFLDISKYEAACFVEFKSRMDDCFGWKMQDGKRAPMEKPSFVKLCDTNAQEEIDFDANILLPQIARQLRGETNCFLPEQLDDSTALLVMSCHVLYAFIGSSEEAPSEANVTIGSLSGRGILLGASKNLFGRFSSGVVDEDEKPIAP